MPLVRVEVRNEYGFGMPELYTETSGEDPKAVLDGVAVAGLVGILRQLGDLAAFAAEVFHGLQEQVLISSSRSHNLVERVHNIVSALPPVEKAILAQRSHLHYAYTAGSHWHTRLSTEHNHFTYGDLPRCIMDFYEDCHDPPCLHKLDKFDAGGPGSCFKRYSDPTHLGRASVGCYETNLQSVQREKKARRSKKKRSLLRYRDVKDEAPVFTHGGSMDFASSNFNGISSPSQHISKFHDAQKSGIEPEMEDHSTSFDSRTESGYIKSIFGPSYSAQSEESEAMKLSSESKVRHNAYLDSASLDENSRVPDEDIQNSYVEHSRPRSSYATWDENLEIMESSRQPNDTTVILCIIDKPDIKKKEDLNSRVVGPIDNNFHDECILTPVFVGGQPDENESETYYVDALNTMESGSETDIDCQTKKDLKQYSRVNNKDEEEKHKAGHLDENSVDYEFCDTEYSFSRKAMSCPCHKSKSPESHMEPYGSSNNETYEDKSKSNQVPNNDQLTSPRMAGTSSIPFTSQDNIKSGKSEMLGNLVTVASNGSFSSSRESNSQPPPGEQILSTHESPKPPSSTSGSHTALVHRATLWTNGGLLGLKPSEPPDLRFPTAVGSDSVAKTKDDETQNSSHKNTMEDDGHVARESESFSKLPGSNGLKLPQGHDFNASSTMTSGTDGLVTKDDPDKASKEKNISSSRIFEFNNRLLVSGLRTQTSLVGNEKLASSLRRDISDKTSMHKGYQSVMGRPLRDGSGSPLTSPSSPPLEHMRLTFQPIDGLETSKLKLKFPDGSNCHESSGHMFPSFQLVPEPDISFHESGSDSDDETFCRSSYSSDDCHSHRSESNSEQWYPSDSPRSKDHELDDSIGKILSGESVSSSHVNGLTFHQGLPDPGKFGLCNPFTECGMEPFQSGCIVDIPKFDSRNASLNQEISNTDRKYFLESCIPKDTPFPPPLPPLEWRSIKPHPIVAIEKEDAVSKALTHALVPRLPEHIVRQQPEPAPLKRSHFVETIGQMPKLKPDLQNLNIQNEAIVPQGK